MDSSVESKASRRCMHQDRCIGFLPHRHDRHHHHQHFLVSPHCPLHGNMMLHLNNHLPSCPLFNLHPFSQNSLPAAQDLRPSESKEAVSDTQENVELEEEEEEEDEDPVFVLTDEWREFFAKSEAKRRQEKKQAKKKGKK